MAETRLLLVRHGESQVTVQRVVGGERSCTGLSPLGVRQSEALRDRLIAEGRTEFDAVISSTMPRALETAAIVADHLAVADIEQMPDLVEHRPGAADGVAFADYRERFGAFDPRSEPDRPLAPGGESLNQFRQRVVGALFDLEQRYSGKSIVVFCHGGVIDIAFRELLRVGLTAPFDLWTLNTAMTEFHRQPQTWLLRRYNDAAHLNGLPHKTVE